MTSTPSAPTRTLGRSSLEVGPLCLGGNVFGWTIDEQRSFAVLDAFVAAGGNFIDTADVYAVWANDGDGGDSETIIGNWIRARGGKPEGLVIATKVGSPMPYGWGLGREHVLDSAKRSIERLGVDAIDLYYAHRDDDDTPLEETLGAFDELVREGLVRAIGASNYGAARLTEALDISEREGWARYEVLQPGYNLIDRADFEGELQQLCLDRGLAVAPYYALAAGFLTGKYQRGGDMPDTRRAKSTLDRYGDERGWRVVAALDQVAGELDATPAQVALAWLASQPGIVAPIASATTVEQLEQLLGAARLQLTQQQLALLDDASTAD
ncbi:MAG: aldo/keto reductase [Thermoleophilia bacterium]|nr:aldo/keto reductase [Thermoleophilia bacterium]